MLVALAAARALAVLLAAQRLGLVPDGRVQHVDPPPMRPGAAGELSVTILEAPAPRMPLAVRLASQTVTLTDPRLDHEHVVDPLAQLPRIRGRFVAPDEPGTHRVEGLVQYVTCDDERCRPRRAHVVWTIEVVGPETATP